MVNKVEYIMDYTFSCAVCMPNSTVNRYLTIKSNGSSAVSTLP